MHKTGVIGAAVIGVGTYGEVHARIYDSDPRTRLLCVWSRSAARARAVGEKYACAYTTDMNDIVKDDDIRIVSVATPDFAHTEPAVRMLAAGKHVLVEKPMAMSTAECMKILEARDTQNSSGAKRAASVDQGIKLMVNCHNRWYPPLAMAKKLIDDGAIGKPVNAFARLSDVISVPLKLIASWSSRTSPLWFLFPHTVDLVCWMFGQKAKSVYASGTKRVLKDKGIDSYDVVQAQVVFEDAVAVFESSWVLPESWRNGLIDFKVDLCGDKGRIGVTGDNEGLEVSTSEHRTPLLYDFVTEEKPVEYFIDCVINDRQPSPGGEEGLAVTGIIEAMQESLLTGRAIDISR